MRPPLATPADHSQLDVLRPHVPLEGQAAIVTGGAGGLGSAIAAALLGAGADVLLVDRDDSQLRAVRERLGDRRRSGGPSGTITELALDVRREDDMARMAQTAIDRHGRIDILVAAAGILRTPGTSPKPLAETSPEEWDAVIDVNLRGVFLANRAVLPAMIAARQGQIVNISSVSGRQGRALDAAYCASKFGVIGLSESLAQEVNRRNIKVHVVLPDAVSTPLWRQNAPIPPPRTILQPERVAEFILFLLQLPPDTMLVAPVITAFDAPRRAEAPGQPTQPSRTCSD